MSNTQDSMIEQAAHVHSIDQTTVWLDTLRLSTCNSCSMKSGCGQRLMNQATDCKRSRIALPVPSTMSLSVGDEVVLGIPQKAFIKASLLTTAGDAFSTSTVKSGNCAARATFDQSKVSSTREMSL